jgi:hypothetical protein
MRPTVYHCQPCDLELRGRFRQTLFERLPPEDQDTLERYLLSDFNIKKMQSDTGLGYTALRTRIDRLIENFTALRRREGEMQWVLDRVERGEITASEGAKLIREMKRDGKRTAAVPS